jgi:hypothetical protein
MKNPKNKLPISNEILKNLPNIVTSQKAKNAPNGPIGFVTAGKSNFMNLNIFKFAF